MVILEMALTVEAASPMATRMVESCRLSIIITAEVDESCVSDSRVYSEKQCTQLTPTKDTGQEENKKGQTR